MKLVSQEKGVATETTGRLIRLGSPERDLRDSGLKGCWLGDMN